MAIATATARHMYLQKELCTEYLDHLTGTLQQIATSRISKLVSSLTPKKLKGPTARSIFLYTYCPEDPSLNCLNPR